VEFPAFPPLVLRCSSGLSPARRAASRLAVVLAEEHPAIGTENHNITGWDAAPIGEASTCNLKWAGGIPWVGCPRCGESCWSLWKLGALTTTKSSTSSYFAARSLPWPSAWLPDPCAAARQSAHRICSWRPGFVCAFPASVWQFRSDTSPRVFLRGALPATRNLGCHCRRLAVPASSPCRPLEQRRSSGGKTWNSAFPFHAMPRGACGLWRRSDTQSSAHRSWGDTQDPCGLGGLEIPAKTAARGQRACHVYRCAILCASVLGATQDPTARRPAIPSGRGTQRARHLATRNPLRIGPRDTQDRRSFLHAHFLLRAAGEQEENGPRSSARRPAKELAGRHAT
jgi:hypothetical protein